LNDLVLVVMIDLVEFLELFLTGLLDFGNEFDHVLINIHQQWVFDIFGVLTIDNIVGRRSVFH